MDALSRLDALPRAAACAAFERCCGAARWAEAMADGRPYRDEAALLAAAERAFGRLERVDWLEAFAHHPRIGERAALAARFPATRAWSAGEQAAVDAAGEDVLGELAEANRAYEARYGYIFIVCATSRTAPEMLALLRARLANDPETELRIAAGEQSKITALRLRKLLEEVPA
jgi:2-oxo-4-hydroxy-4-carboxy-5-ureidoimidazoline decarboxylase